MKVNLHNPPEEVQIQIIPLIDVVFCIMTFFLLGAVNFTRQQAINVDLPSAATSTPVTGATSDLYVTISAAGQLYIEKEPIGTQDLEPRLRQYVATNPNGTLVLYAAPTAVYNDVVQTIDILRKVGGSRVSFATIPKPPESGLNPQGIPTDPTIPLPGNIPIPGVNPADPNQLPNNGQGTNPLGNFPIGIPQAPSGQIPGTVPVDPYTGVPLPNTGAPQPPTEPGTTNPTP